MEPTHIAAKALARTASVHYAARKSGLDVEEVRRLYREDHAFGTLVLEYSTSRTMRAAKALEDIVPLAIEVLKQEMSIQPRAAKQVRRGRPPKGPPNGPVRYEKPAEGDPRRVRAAKIALENYWKAKDMIDIVSRLSRLEQGLTARPVDIQVIPAITDGSDSDADE